MFVNRSYVHLKWSVLILRRVESGRLDMADSTLDANGTYSSRRK
jgi:hypothetical protein